MTTPPASDMQPTSGKAIGSLVTGILSPFFCLYWFLCLPLAIVAIVLGVLGRNDTKVGTHKGSGMAMTGIILGALGAVLGLLFLAAVFIFPEAVGDAGLTDWICEQQPDNEICQ